MKQMIIHLFLVLLVLTSCQNMGSGAGTTHSDSTSIAVTEVKKPYTPPAIPVMLTDKEQKIDFLVNHYWDNFPMTDTTYIGEKNVMEQAFVDYLYLLSNFDGHMQRKGFGVLLDKALNGDKAMYYSFAEIMEHYLYDPNAPTRNEDQYIIVLEHIIAMDKLEDVDKYRPRYQLEMAKKNRPGDKAADFSYKLRNGKSGTLVGLKADYTLLYLFNPDCHACEEVTRALMAQPVIRQMLANKRLTILAIYPDEDMELWEKGKHKLPQEWMVGYDWPRVITAKQLYDLRATPTMLLLDKEKRVIKKDVQIEELEEYFRNLE